MADKDATKKILSYSNVNKYIRQLNSPLDDEKVRKEMSDYSEERIQYIQDSLKRSNEMAASLLRHMLEENASNPTDAVTMGMAITTFLTAIMWSADDESLTTAFGVISEQLKAKLMIGILCQLSGKRPELDFATIIKDLP